MERTVVNDLTHSVNLSPVILVEPEIYDKRPLSLSGTLGANLDDAVVSRRNRQRITSRHVARRIFKRSRLRVKFAQIELPLGFGFQQLNSLFDTLQTQFEMRRKL